MRSADICLWAIACGVRADKNAFRPYTERLFADIYKNPFEKVIDFKTGQEVIQHLLGGGE